MAEIRVVNRQSITKSLGRMQACIDQLVGQDTFITAGTVAPIDEHMAAIRRQVVQLMQLELDSIMEETGMRSPAGYADGSEWLLGELRK